MALGVGLYNALAGRPRSLPRGGVTAGEGVRRRFPYLGSRFAGAVWTYEGRIHAPERIAVELVEDGVSAGSRSAALNYCRLVGVEGSDLQLEDSLSSHGFTVKARAVVNAAGAHADRVARLFGVEQRMTGGVAGTHLVLDAPALAAALGNDLLFFEDGNNEPAKRRLCVVYRLAGDRVLLGTAESRCDEPDSAMLTEADAHYLLAALRAALPEPAASAKVVGHTIGVRPLAHSDEADLAGRSRDHAVFRHQPNGLPLITVVGGKWTTFRVMAEDAADATLAALGKPRVRSTADLAIGCGARFRAGHAALEAALAGQGVAPSLARRLVETYGMRARRVARFVTEDGGVEPLSEDGRLTRGELRFFIAKEMAASPDDVIRRRSDQCFRASDLDALSLRLAAELSRSGTSARAPS